MRSYSAVVAEELFSFSVEKVHLCVVRIFRFTFFPPFLFRASKPSQNDVDIMDNEEAPGLFKDFVKVDSSVHDFEIESGNSVPSMRCNVKGRSSRLCQYY